MEGEISLDLVHNLIGKQKRSERARPGSSSTSSDELLAVLAEEDREAAMCLMYLSKATWDWDCKKIRMYECSTCNRSFCSYQALGGHRASHKKRKIANEGQRECLAATPLAAAAVGRKIQVHECMICGVVYSSGQALGGHMRRHKAISATNSQLEPTLMITATAETKLDNLSVSAIQSLMCPDAEQTGNETNRSVNEFQQLDLNSPPPAVSSSEDEISETILVRNNIW